MGSRHSSIFTQALSVGLVLCAVASCSLVGASLDPLTAGGNCPANAELCDGVCVDLSSSSAQCGSCGHACGQGEACVGGKCQVSCPGGQVACDSLCFATANDPKHCGDCGTVCKAGEVCGDAHCSSSCPDGQTNCDGSCADVQTDSKHCGGCGTVCSPNDECVEGKCVIACKTQLNQPITDPWGWSWDGLERAASSFEEAKSMCNQFRGRLPTVSELHRVSATQSATVGQTLHTNQLWSLAPSDPNTHVRVRLSDAAISTVADTAKTNFRCVCPPRLPKPYVGGNCYGAANTNACATLEDETKKHNLDTKDRPPVSKTTATWECAFYGGHLASPLELAEAVQQGIGGGSGAWLHTANEVRHDLGALLKWTDGKNFVYQYTSGNTDSLSWAQPTSSQAFRCVGENVTPAALPPVPGEWPNASHRKIESVDGADSTLIEAVDQCWKNGGHLPTVAELSELILLGLPNGTGAWLWTSDQTGHDSKNFTVAITKWTDVDTSHVYGGGNMTWSYKNVTRAHRCVYYPVDPTFKGPPATSCQGACTEIPVPGASGAKLWLDANDRPQAANVTVAIDTCRKAGGHLASERDLTEAIRAGLPNGSDTFIDTSDPMLGNQSGVLVGNVKWAGTNAGFDDLWPANSTWAWAYDPRPFRCVWTNELR